MLPRRNGIADPVDQLQLHAEVAIEDQRSTARYLVICRSHQPQTLDIAIPLHGNQANGRYS